MQLLIFYSFLRNRQEQQEVANKKKQLKYKNIPELIPSFNFGPNQWTDIRTFIITEFIFQI